MIDKKVLRGALVSSLLFSSTAFASFEKFESTKFLIKPYLEAASYEFSMRSLEPTARELDWTPNARSLTGIDLYIAGLIGFGFAGKGTLSAEDRVKKGDTQYEDYRFSFAFERIHLSLNHQKYRGFYLSNSSSVDPSIGEGDPYIQSSSLATRNTSILFTWVNRPDHFSIEATLDQTVRQSQPGGSWLLGAALADSAITNDGPIIPAAVQAQFGSDRLVSAMKFQTASIRGGYGHTFVTGEKWFLTLLGMLGYGPQISKVTVDGVTNDTIRGAMKTDLHIAAGYNGDEYVSGINFNFDSTVYQTSSLTVTGKINSGKLYLGRRF